MILCFIEKRLVQAKSSVGTAVRCGTQGAYISAPCFLLLNYLPGKSQADIGVSSCKSRFFCRNFAQISNFTYSRVLYPFFPESRTNRQILPNICVVDDKDDKSDKSDSYIFIVLILPNVSAVRIINLKIIFDFNLSDVVFLIRFEINMIVIQVILPLIHHPFQNASRKIFA